MQVYEAFKLENFANLQIDLSALYLLAAPKTPLPQCWKLAGKAQAGRGNRAPRKTRQLTTGIRPLYDRGV
jgi:hypothetical protein